LVSLELPIGNPCVSLGLLSIKSDEASSTVAGIQSYNHITYLVVSYDYPWDFAVALLQLPWAVCSTLFSPVLGKSCQWCHYKSLSR